ncbi:MAG: hypothetical protein LBL62_11600 [Planctomycetaceae bacterium]|nr:hypothetical protein [Planctomycetaceae bacterium]
MFIVEAVIVGGFYQAVTFADFPAVDTNNVILDFPQRISVFNPEDETIHPKENQTSQQIGNYCNYPVVITPQRP